MILACPTQHVSCINTLVRRSGGSSTDKKSIHNKQLVLTDLPLSSDSSGSELFKVVFPGFCRKLDNHLIQTGPARQRMRTNGHHAINLKFNSGPIALGRM